MNGLGNWRKRKRKDLEKIPDTITCACGHSANTDKFKKSVMRKRTLQAILVCVNCYKDLYAYDIRPEAFKMEHSGVVVGV